jgi:predicted DNA-binding transcriptional regulator YafY
VLQDQGARFEEKILPRTREKVFVMVKGPKWDETISRETRLALRVAALALGQGGNAILQKQLETLEQITGNSLTDRDRKFHDRLRRNIRVKGGVVEKSGDLQVTILETVFKAFSEEIPRQMELEYRRPGATGLRKIILSPYCLTQDLLSGGTYLLGEDAEKHRVMQLRLSRIQSAKILNRPVIFLKQAELELAAEYQIGGWVNPDKPFDVRLRLEGDAWIQAMEEAPPDFPGFQIKPSGSTAIVTFKANAVEGLIRWILQLGHFAEVLEPDDLRMKVKASVEKMAKLYQ